VTAERVGGESGATEKVEIWEKRGRVVEAPVFQLLPRRAADRRAVKSEREMTSVMLSAWKSWPLQVRERIRQVVQRIRQGSQEFLQLFA
jgi:hypothetical protein